MTYKRSVLVIFGFIFVLSSCTDNTVSTDNFYQQVELPDGSVVLLNHNSSVTYSKGFDSRNINLQGEAYFKVVEAKNPFVVITALGEIKVTGTKFNVKSAEDELEVEVESGEVELSTDSETKEIEKGQRATYKSEDESIETGEATYEFKIWLKELEIELVKAGKVIGRESKKLGKEVKKESIKLNKKLKELE